MINPIEGGISRRKFIRKFIGGGGMTGFTLAGGDKALENAERLFEGMRLVGGLAGRFLEEMSSRGGQKVAFIREINRRGGEVSREVWTMTMGRGGDLVLKRVTDKPNPLNPTVAPNGNVLVSVELPGTEESRHPLGNRGVLRFPGERLVAPLSEFPYQVKGVVSPEGKTVALEVLDENSTNDIYLVDLRGNSKHLAQGHSPTWGPTEKYVAFERDGGIFVINVESGKECLIIRGGGVPPDGFYLPDWSPNGKAIVVNHINTSTTPETAEIGVLRGKGRGWVYEPLKTPNMLAYHPTWVGNGVIVFMGSKTREGVVGNWDLWALTWPGGKLTQLTSTAESDEMWPST